MKILKFRMTAHLVDGQQIQSQWITESDLPFEGYESKNFETMEQVVTEGRRMADLIGNLTHVTVETGNDNFTAIKGECISYIVFETWTSLDEQRKHDPQDVTG